MKTAEYLERTPMAASNLSQVFPIFFICVYMLPLYYMVSRLSEEKESRTREAMKMMGLSDRSYYLSWFVSNAFVTAVVSLLNIAVLQVEVFTESSVFLMLLMCFLYGTQLFGFSFTIVAVFSSKKASATAATILHLSTFYLVFMYKGYGSSLSEKSLVACLVPNCSLGFMLEHLLHCEIEGGTALNMATALMPYQSFNFVLGLVCQILCSSLWALIGLYLDKTMPREFGKAESFGFLCRSKPKPSISNFQDSEVHDPKLVAQGNFEADSADYMRRSEMIKIRNLRKVYKNGFVAVKNESLTLYAGQIFALLGHNGAGKTTTINMLTGLLEPTEGLAIFQDQDIFQDMNTLRENLGVCPQHNVLFDTLTVREHLEMFCNLKGDLDELEMLKRVDRMVQQIELDDVQFQLARTLSGGQKRKLSVGIALIGNAKVIMLDEPTSGMDTTTRRRFWDMIKQYKHDRIIILTTHYMDEADVLGDRICIMAEGKVQCCGSPLFLKNRFGVGYNLKMIKAPGMAAADVERYMANKLPEAKKLQDVQNEMVWQLPEPSRSKFKVFFNQLDRDLDSLKLKSYGVSITTLEEVFLKIGHGQGENHTIEKIKEKTADLSKLTPRERQLVDYSIATQNHKSFKAEMCALMKKKVLVQARDLRSCIMDIFLPSLMIFIGVYVAQLEIIPEGHPTRALSLYDYPTNIPLVRNSKSNFSSTEELDNYFTFAFGADIGDQKMWSHDVVVDVEIESQFFEQIAVIDDYLFTTRNESGPYFTEPFVQMADAEERKYSLVSLVNATQPSIIMASTAYLLQGVIRTEIQDPNFKLNIFEAQLPFGMEWQVYINTGFGLLSCFGFAVAYMMISDTLIQSLIKEKQLAIKHQIIISGGSKLTYWLSHYFIDVGTHAVPAGVALAAIWHFKIDAVGSEVLFGWFVTVNPIFIYAVQFCFSNDSQASVFIRIFCFLFGSVAPIAMQVLQVINRETVQIANYLKGYFKYVPLYNMNFGYISITNRQIVEAFQNLPKNSLEPLDWECAGENIHMIKVICVMSLLVILAIENNVLKVGLRPMLRPIQVHLEMINESLQRKKPRKPYNLKKLAQMDTDEFQTASRSYVKRIEDEDPLAEQERIKTLENTALKVDSLTKSYTPFTKAVDNLSFALDYGECFALLGITGAGKTTTFKCLCQEEIPDQGSLYMAGHDVRSKIGFASARQKVGYCPQFDAIYDNLTVLEHLQFYAAIKGVHPSLQEDLIAYQIKELDLCYYTHFRAGQLSGGNKRKLSCAIALLGNPPLLLLDEPSTGVDPQAKRFMWTVISNISTLRKKSTVVLTTHSMEEAEALCPKMGIMVDGRFQCFGSAQHIKDKYADGFDLGVKIAPCNSQYLANKCHMAVSATVSEDEIQERVLEPLGFSDLDEGKLKEELRMKPPYLVGDVVQWAHCEYYAAKLIDNLTSSFGSCTVIDKQSGGLLNLKIPRNNRSIGFVFGFMEENKAQCQVQEYSATQTTLEQIFNMFAKQKGVKDRHESLEKDPHKLL